MQTRARSNRGFVVLEEASMQIKNKTEINPNYNTTMLACFTGLIVQAIIVNFAPLLFLTFQTTYNLSLPQVTLLITFNFAIQLTTDIVAIVIIDKLGYRVSAVLAHVFGCVGLMSMAVLPELFSNALTGLIVSVIIYAIGGGLLEVLMTPMVEACPNENKEKAMSMLHSFYCWGQVGVIALSTLFFVIVGMERWKLLCVLWAIIPFVNGFCFTRVPIATLIAEDESGMTIKELFSTKIFWLFLLIMVCAGASEHVVAQWASAFAEKGLGVSKTIGDLAGPMTFAIAMGTTRTVYAHYSEKWRIESAIIVSSVLCIISFLMISLSPNSVVGLLGCTLTGVAVAMMWPGTCSMAAASIKRGGVAMFAILALAGDLGCSVGPTVVGNVASLFEDNLRMGILVAVVFPVLMIVGIMFCTSKKVFK